MTPDEIDAVLAQYSRDTGKWDPMLNGESDKALKGLDPNAEGLSAEQRKEIVRQRGVILHRFQWGHDIMVGQRMAVSGLRYRFRQMIRDRTAAEVDATPWTGMRDCCKAYVDGLDHLDAQWAEEARQWRDGTHSLINWRQEHRAKGEDVSDLTPEVEAEIMDKCIADNAVIREQVTTGQYTIRGNDGARLRQCCPWDDRIDHGPFLSSFRAITSYLNEGGKMEDLTFGPIEVLPDKYRY